MCRVGGRVRGEAAGLEGGRSGGFAWTTLAVAEVGGCCKVKRFRERNSQSGRGRLRDLARLRPKSGTLGGLRFPTGWASVRAGIARFGDQNIFPDSGTPTSKATYRLHPVVSVRSFDYPSEEAMVRDDDDVLLLARADIVPDPLCAVDIVLLVVALERARVLVPFRIPFAL